MNKIIAKVTKRTLFGRKIKKLRKEGIIPANIFGKKTKSLAVQLPFNNFLKLFEKAGETSIVYLELDKQKEQKPCLITNVQINPVTHKPIHVDFRQVDLTEKVTANIPLELIGKSPAVDAENASVVSQFQEIEVEALPANLPERFVLDIDKLQKVGDNLTVANLDYDKSKVEVKLSVDTILVSAQAQQEEEPELEPLVDAKEEEEEAKEGESPADDEGKEESKQESKSEDKKDEK